ncbi:MAG: exodeoxyribonuclease VII large subunit [Synergistes sp.]|nr:exodeoxyribonuclease VII large subunit [Synergistes sp.]
MAFSDEFPVNIARMKTINDSIMTVDDVTARISCAVQREPELQNVSVLGELLGFKRHTSGHAYFTLIGRESRIACVLFRSYAASVLTWPKNGDEVLVRGKVSVYGAQGSYQIYAVTLLPIGAGAKARAKEETRRRLEAEGLFDPRLKRRIPRFPQRVAVITSPTGAALQDIIKLHASRFPCAEIIVVPSLMQGLDAPVNIVSAFERVRKIKDVSCVVLARGGGNRDDLDVFDNEDVVRAVRLSPVPVVTGLGHQIDSTFCDLAADLCAPTPSGAAERIFPDGDALSSALANTAHNMKNRLETRIAGTKNDLSALKRRMDAEIINSYILPEKESIKHIYESLRKDISLKVKNEETKLSAYAARLDNVSPLKLIARGYSVCTGDDGGVIRSASFLSVGDTVNVVMSDGCARCTVNEVTDDRVLFQAR